MVNHYPDLPKRVMGLKCSQHRAFKMIQILNQYKKRCRQTAKKEHMLRLMVSLEREITEAEKKLVRDWMLSDSKVFEEALSRETVRPEQPQYSEAGDSDLDITLAIPLNLECSVCVDSFPEHDFPQHPITESCYHEVTVCNTCTRRSVKVQIEDQPYEQIACLECPELLTLDTIRMFSSPDDFDRYTMKSFKESLQRMEGYVKCLGPNCDSGQIHGSGHDQPIMTCPECHFKTCYTHMMPWHTGKTCAEYNEEQRVRLEQEEASKRVIAKTSKPCPNPNCGHSIEKNGGCDHMTCRKCKHEFCWLCMAPYKKIREVDNSVHEDTCKHHPSRLPSYIAPIERPFLG